MQFSIKGKFGAHMAKDRAAKAAHDLADANTVAAATAPPAPTPVAPDSATADAAPPTVAALTPKV